MNKRIAALLLAAALAPVAMNGWADDANATGNNNDPVKHPVNAITNHEVKSDMKDSQESSQKAAEARKAYKQAKADYEKALKENGAGSDVTRAARKRKDEAYHDLSKYNKKTAEANRELKKDESKAQQE